MLTERLKNGELFGEPSKESKDKTAARALLSNAVQDLVTAMRAVELDGLYTREDIEAYVLKMMGSYEETLYAMDEEEFDAYLNIALTNAIARRRMSR